MRHTRLQAQVVGALIAGALLVQLSLMFAGCSNLAGDCHNTLSCPPPSCAEAGDVEGCHSEDGGENEDRGTDAQED